MSRAFPNSGQILWIITVSSIIVTLSSSDRALEEDQVQNVPNRCSQKHCRDCDSSEDLICSNGTTSNRCGDLCGCCRSCVQLRDLGASCGSQLAVRYSSVNFEDSRPRVTIIATASCRSGLICTNFTCERLDDPVDRVDAAPVEPDNAKTEGKFRSSKSDGAGSVESDDSTTNLVTAERTDKYNYPHRDYDIVDKRVDKNHVFDTREIDLRTSTSIPGPIRLTTGIVSSIGTNVDEISTMRRDETRSGTKFENHELQDEIECNPKNVFDSPGHLVNVMMAGREFQLIYGNEALSDLRLLLNFIDKSKSTSVIDESEALLLYDRFKDVLQLANGNSDSSSLNEVTDSSSATVNSQVQSEDDDLRFIETVRDSGTLGLLRKFIVSRSSRIPGSRVPIGLFRGKREAEEANPRSEYSEVVVYDFLNKTPRTVEDLPRHWSIGREVGTGSEKKLPTSERSVPEGMESAINIHITGMPRVTKSSGEVDPIEEQETRERRTLAAGEDYENYDDELEIFVTDSNNDVPALSRTDENQQNFTNFTQSTMPQDYTDVENERDRYDNVTDQYWETSISPDRNSQYADSGYEFTFPEEPVTLETDDYRDLSLRVNETVDEFRAQLNRIETKIVVIQSSLYDMITKFETNEQSRNIGTGESVRDTRTSTYFPHSNFTGRRRTTTNDRGPSISKSEVPKQFMIRYVRQPRAKGTYRPTGNSTLINLGSSRRNQNSRNFNIEDEGIAEFVPIRSNRQWRTVTLQPNSAEVRRMSRSRGRRYRNEVNEELPHDPRRRKATQRRADSGYRESVVRRSNMRKEPNDPIRSTVQIQSPIFLSNADTRSYSIVRSPSLFSRDYSLGEKSNPSTSNRQVVWPLNPGWNRPQSTDRSKKRSTEANRRGGINAEIEEPLIAESAMTPETQIPKSIVRAIKSKDFDNRMSGSSTSLAAAMIPLPATMKHSFIDENNWNWSSWDDEPSLNLFVVNGETNSDFGSEASSGSREFPASLVLPLENETPRVDDNWEVAYPAYLDYSESLSKVEESEKDDIPIIKTEATESSKDLRRNRRINIESGKRKRRNIVDVSRAEKISKTIISRSDNGPADMKNLTGDKSLSGKISKRSVQMVDWLRAAQEYHERLHQVRNAALRTWLASREELADTNLTNVKLFTREIPAYLEKYRPSFTAEDDSMLKSEASNRYPMEVPQARSTDDSEFFTELLNNQSLPSKNDSKSMIQDAKNSQDSSSQVNSSMARKFTIIATGNSTIRIEELPDIRNDSRESLFEDQSAQGSIDSELSMAHRMPITSSDSEDFDHMYESFDANDEDFDYVDPNFGLSRWLDEVDIIDSSSVEIPDDKTKLTGDDSSNDDEDYEVDELLSRSKRDAPLFLFKIKGNPSQDVLVWTSNWKDFINRHFKRNRTRNFAASPPRTTKKSQRRITNFETASTTNLDTRIKASNSRDAEVASSAKKISGEEYDEDSRSELDLARRLRQAFDHRPGHNRRKGYYRSNIENYK